MVNQSFKLLRKTTYQKIENKMGEESTNPRSGADAKGNARIRSYEKRKEAKKAAKIAVDPTIKITTFWEKIGKDGSWEEKEYHQKIKEDADK